MIKKLLLTLPFLIFIVGNLSAQCNVAAEGAQISSTASGCASATMPLGSGAYRDLALAANTWYSFSWADNGVSTSGFCASVQSGGAGATSSSFTTAQTAWFSGTTAPVLRVSSNRSSATWSTSSATLTYAHVTPSAVSVSGGGSICGSGTLTASGGTNGTVYWQSTTSGGTSTATPSASQTVSSAGTYYFRPGNNGCWGTEGSASITIAPLTISGTTSICGVGGTTDLGVAGEADWTTMPTGGTITTSGNDYIHSFNSSGTFNTVQAISGARVLVVGGGGGGGSNGGGGGGAGGMVHNTGVSIGTGNTTVTVGAGGAGGGSPAANGGSSAFGAITAGGGGGGASRDAGAGGQNGGSGGGGGGSSVATATATGSGGTSEATTYGGSGNTNISINFPALPSGSVVTGISTAITYTANGASWRSEVRVEVTPPATVGGVQTDLQPSTLGSAGTVTAANFGTYSTGNPAGTWLFRFRETTNDSGPNPDANISNITITVTYGRNGGGAGTGGQGNNGGNGTNPDAGCFSAGGGGGGAGGAGGTASNDVAGAGGAGLQNNITGTNLFYAGGGGGGLTGFPGCGASAAASPGGGAGGSGVGGNGESTAGTANRGGGGGAERDGGSGVVIVRYTAPKWTSSNTAVATVNAQTGLVTAVSAGTTTITYTSATGCTATATVTVYAPSVAPTSITGSGATVCHGNTVSLTAAGGSLSAGASYEWFTGSCGGTAAGTGSSINVSPTATTTYYVRAGAGTGCPATACASGTITLPTAGTTLATNGESATCNVSGSNWIHFYTSGGNLIASINPNGNNLGSVTATAYVGGGAALTQACGTGSNPSFTTAALGRSWLITPTNNLSASVRFPFASGELAALVTASAGTSGNALDNVSGIGDLKMSHYSGPNNLNGSWSDNCTSAGGSGGTQLVGAQGGSGAITLANGFIAAIGSGSYVQFNTPGFSEFWLHGDGGTSPLPVTLTNFSATCSEQSEVQLNWSTASEHNSQKFILEKSRDLGHWLTVGEREASGNSNYKIDYFMADHEPFGGISYYRLVQVDNDGAQEIFGPVSVSCGNNANNMIVFPNPSKGSFTVEITSTENIPNAGVQLTDLTGKVISTRELNIYEGKNQLMFEGADLQLGTYIVKVISKSTFSPVRVVIN